MHPAAAEVHSRSALYDAWASMCLKSQSRSCASIIACNAWQGVGLPTAAMLPNAAPTTAPTLTPLSLACPAMEAQFAGHQDHSTKGGKRAAAVIAMTSTGGMALHLALVLPRCKPGGTGW